jgi:hypothetical protein
MDYDDYFGGDEEFRDEFRPPDHVEAKAVAELRIFFQTNRQVFSSRQVQVLFEGTYFHWITLRALKILADEGSIRLEKRTLSYGAPINFVWHRSNRYNRREIKEIEQLVERYSDPEFTAALGNTGELLVSDGFGRFGFVQRGREARAFGGREWTRTEHNLDFLFERDARVYGVEVKNTLPYIDDKEFRTKLNICAHLHVIPLFVVRAMPRIWVLDVVRQGGFVLILKHQLYPLSHKSFAAEVRTRLQLPVDAPKALYDGTMQRFTTWHDKQLGLRDE